MPGGGGAPGLSTSSAARSSLRAASRGPRCRESRPSCRSFSARRSATAPGARLASCSRIALSSAVGGRRCPGCSGLLLLRGRGRLGAVRLRLLGARLLLLLLFLLVRLVMPDGTPRRRAYRAVADHMARDAADDGALRAPGLCRRGAEAGPEGKGQRCRRNQDRSHGELPAHRYRPQVAGAKSGAETAADPNLIPGGGPATSEPVWVALLEVRAERHGVEHGLEAEDDAYKGKSGGGDVEPAGVIPG